MIDKNDINAVTEYRDVSTILDSYRADEYAAQDAFVIANAIAQASNAYTKALKNRKYDEARGIADRIELYARKGKSLAGTLAVKGAR